MTTTLTATLAIRAGDEIGEGPAWDRAGQRLIWADHKTGVVHTATAHGDGWREGQRWELKRHLAAVVPRASGGLVAVGAADILMLDAAGNVAPFAHIDFDEKLFRLNDAKCDPQGRLWAGTLATDFSPRAALYRIDPDGRVTTMLEGVSLSNGLDWSPDGATFYYVDSIALTIDAFDFDGARGAIANRRTIVKLAFGDGAANGITVDNEGSIWVALTGGGEVRRYAPDGALLTRVSVSAPGATSCAFGGPKGEDLFITTRSGRMPDVAMKLGVRPDMMDGTGPEAGALYVCRPGQTGAPATPFAG